MNILETDASTTKYHTILKTIPVQKPIKAHLPYSLAEIGVSLLCTTNKISPTSGIKNDNTFNPADGVSFITLTLCCAAPQLGHISAFSLIIVPHSRQNDLCNGSNCGLFSDVTFVFSVWFSIVIFLSLHIVLFLWY